MYVDVRIGQIIPVDGQHFLGAPAQAFQDLQAMQQHQAFCLRHQQTAQPEDRSTLATASAQAAAMLKPPVLAEAAKRKRRSAGLLQRGTFIICNVRPWTSATHLGLSMQAEEQPRLPAQAPTWLAWLRLRGTARSGLGNLGGECASVQGSTTSREPTADTFTVVIMPGRCFAPGLERQPCSRSILTS